jgi:hypothetical protein
MTKLSDQIDWETTVRQVAYGDDGFVRRRELGVLAIVIFVVVGIIAIVLLVIEQVNHNASGVFKLIAPLVFVAFVVVRLYQRLMVRSASELLGHDKRQPVLYLRSFEEDETSVSGAKGVYERDDTFERKLTKSLSRVGPVIAVGKPGSLVPPFGACRVNLNPEGESWKDAVRTLIGIARLVVIRCTGKLGEGTLWELRTLLECAPPEKLILVLTPTLKNCDTDLYMSAYSPFWEQTHALFAKPLPQDPKKAKFLAFDANHNPRFIYTVGEFVQKLSLSPGQERNAAKK